MKLAPLIALSAILLLAACTPDRSLDSGSPYWPGEYRDGYNDGGYHQ
jgi:hypothetical protein